MTTRKVLLADDDELLASLLNFRLKKGGYEVHHSANGKEVKEYLKEQMPDIIVSDIMMPYFSGIELIDYVRNELSSGYTYHHYFFCRKRRECSKCF